MSNKPNVLIQINSELELKELNLVKALQLGLITWFEYFAELRKLYADN